MTSPGQRKKKAEARKGRKISPAFAGRFTAAVRKAAEERFPDCRRLRHCFRLRRGGRHPAGIPRRSCSPHASRRRESGTHETLQSRIRVTLDAASVRRTDIFRRCAKFGRGTPPAVTHDAALPIPADFPRSADFSPAGGRRTASAFAVRFFILGASALFARGAVRTDAAQT